MVRRHYLHLDHDVLGHRASVTQQTCFRARGGENAAKVRPYLHTTETRETTQLREGRSSAFYTFANAASANSYSERVKTRISFYSITVRKIKKNRGRDVCHTFPLLNHSSGSICCCFFVQKNIINKPK